MKRLRTLVVMHTTLVPPETLTGHSEKEIEEWRTEYDVVSTLKKSGHEVRCLGISDSVEELRSVITEWKPEIVFNLLEEFDGIVTYDQHVVAFLELLRQPYTGCNPRGLLLSRDKALCKQVFAFHRIPSPQFEVFRRGQRLKLPRKLRFPLFVKSATDDASLGISQASIVHDAERLRERVQFIHEQAQSDALAEQYIEGRELYVGVMGNERLTTFPVWELDFGKLSDVQAGIATRKVKWDSAYQRRHGIRTGPADDLGEAQVGRIAALAKRVYRALHMSGYARMDLRLRPDGSVFVLEANANPNLTYGEDFAESAEVAGISYEQLLNRIVQLGLNYQPEWRLFD